MAEQCGQIPISIPSQPHITLVLEFHVQREDSRTYQTSLAAKERTDVLQDVIGIQPTRPAGPAP